MQGYPLEPGVLGRAPLVGVGVDFSADAHKVDATVVEAATSGDERE